MTDELILSSLISSRICHDLISPIGAINNGLELLAMTSAGESEEIALISTSAKSASDSLRFMRIAFGGASKTEMMQTAEVGSIAAAHIGTQRLDVAWSAERGEVSRAVAKLILLMVQAAASAAPLGGVLTIEDAAGSGFPYDIALSGGKVGFAAEAATALKGAVDLEDIEPRFASFALLHRVAESAGYRVDWRMQATEGRLMLT